MSQIRPALVTFAALALLTGLAYPLVVTGISQVAFPRQAKGSLILQNGQVVGSHLLGQHTEDPGYFWGRLSATGGFPTNPLASGASNLSAHNPDLKKDAERRIRALRTLDPGNPSPVPVDLVTASASGLDPHISPAAAEYQVGRVARVRHLDPEHLRVLVARHTQGRALGVFGEARVNVLELNLELEQR